MRTKLLFALGLACATAQAQAQDPGIQVRLSGQVSRSIMYVNDSREKEWFNSDNENSGTRFRFNADGPAGPGLKAGVLFEVEFQSNATNEVTFATRQVAPQMLERHMDVFLTGGFGTVRLGQGDGAANGASEVDLSGTAIAHYAQTPDIGGAFEYRTSAGALSGASLNATISNQDFESRYDRLYYLSPSFSGLTGEASWGNKQGDVVEFAVRYSGKLAGLGQIAAAIGYSKEEGTGGAADDKTAGGSVSWLHGSGINLTFSHTSRDLPGRTGKFNYLKAGYKFGKHAASIDYAMGDDQAASGDEAKQIGIGYVWTPIAWAEVFGLYKVHSMDRPGVSLEDIKIFMVGSRVKF